MSNLLEQNLTKPVFEVAVREVKERFIQVASEETYLKEAGFAMQKIRGNPVLQKCPKASIQEAVLNVALTGLTLNPVYSFAHLVPRDGKCCLDIDYKGLVHLATKQGGITSIKASVVYTWDEFEYDEGTRNFIHHRQNLNPPEDPDVIGRDPKKIWEYLLCAYSMATFPNGQTDFVIVPKWRLLKIYSTSKGKDNAKMPWQTFPEEMIRKTAIKYHYKTLPKNEGMAKAVALLHDQEGLDLDPQTNSKRLMEAFNVEPEQIENEPIEEITDEPIDPEEQQSVLCTDKQVKLINTLYSNLGIGKREDRLEDVYMCMLIQIDTLKELTKNDASKLIANLKERIVRKEQG